MAGLRQIRKQMAAAAGGRRLKELACPRPHTSSRVYSVFYRIAMKTANTDESQLMNGKVIKHLPKVILSMNDLFR